MRGVRSSARREAVRKRSVHVVHEHFEPPRNAAIGRTPRIMKLFLEGTQLARFNLNPHPFGHTAYRQLGNLKPGGNFPGTLTG